MSDRDLAKDELTKLTASWCNTLSAGGLITGVFAPVFQSFGRTITPADPMSPDWAVVYASLLYLTSGCIMHIIARMLIELRFRP